MDLTRYKVIQNTKINCEDFIFVDPQHLKHPLPPLVSVENFISAGGVPTLKIRATLYINSEFTQNPIVSVPTLKETSLEIYFDYDYTEDTPETCDVWYVEIDYYSTDVTQIKEVISYLRNVDPETSRGTKTGVGD
ncbi:hypothetical protein [Flavobacterium johnsoniae]|uniref:Uncharacterized protein n=1 Tax=Flavobacterium johnsoniae TaxID=986 RepID=A0A1M5GNZ9_FLAJO|nr:hypothetical protein [Flavobacterium johnsoniae]SHG05464.1 hypothetical protein SAMN05444388_101499 [Flavobacterium johnsoniae]